MPAQVIREESFSPKEHMQELQEMHGQCVSLYLPLNGAQEGATLFPTRMRAALNKAKQLLTEEFGDEAGSEWPPEELTGFGQKVRRGPQYGGIAVFCCDGHTRIIHAPKQWNEGVHVGNEFYIRPLLSLLMRPAAFYLLALGEQNIRLLLCTSEGAKDVALSDDLPGNLTEATLFEQPDHNLEQRSTSGAMMTGKRGIRFGTSADEEKRDVYLRQFFSKLDASLRALLTSQQYPLMLAGVKRQLALYADVNTYEHLLGDHIEGSPKWLSSVDLYQLAGEAWAAFQKATEIEILKELDRADSQAKLVKDTIELLPAVESGRIHHLVLPEMETGDATDDMVNHLAVAALRLGTHVSVFSSHSVPGGSAAGILRYGREEKPVRARAS